MMKRIQFMLFVYLCAVSIAGCNNNSTDTPETTYTPCECEGKAILKILKDEPAYIIKGCFDYFEKVDSFSIVLVTELPYEGIHISQELFPCGGVPDEYCADSALVLISGNITSCVAGNNCLMSPEVRLAPTNMIELTSIKRVKK